MAVPLVTTCKAFLVARTKAFHQIDEILGVGISLLIVSYNLLKIKTFTTKVRQPEELEIICT